MKTLYCCIISLLFCCSLVHAEDWKCGNKDTASSVQTIQNQTTPLIVIFIDFPDGRIQPGNIVPTQDSDTLSVININAVGGMGYVRTVPNNPNSPLRKSIRKYVYEDYWNMYFSQGTYAEDTSRNYHPHPDWSSHNISVYGSLTDYYKEATYNNIRLTAEPTHPGGSDMYHTGIANRITTVNGKNYIQWIMMPNNKYTYDTNGLRLYVSDLVNLKNQGLIDFDPIASNFEARGGRIITVNGGFSLGGISLDYSTAVREKRLANTDNQSTLDGIWVSAHELGHTFGAHHTLTGYYDVMNYTSRGAWVTEYYCPQHFNPWFKIDKGWIPANNIQIVGTNNYLALPPITDLPNGNNPMVSIIKVYGDAGRILNGDPTTRFDHSEYFIIEYRKRTGFNRLAGGLNAPSNYQGGALIWNYSAWSGMSFDNNITHLVPKFGPAPLNDDGGRVGSTDDLFPTRTSLDTSTCPSCLPNSGSFDNMTTGIYLSDFTVSSDASELTYNVNYQIAAAPNYDYVYTGGYIPSLSGNILMNGNMDISSSTITISPGATLDFVPNMFLYVHGTGTKFTALGGSAASDSIRFRGVGYGNYRAQWFGISFDNRDQTDSVLIRNSVIQDAIAGLILDESFSNGSLIPFNIQGNRFSHNKCDISFYGKLNSISPIPDISGLDNNIYSKFNLKGNCVLSSANQFVIPSGALLLINGGTKPSRLSIDNGKSLIVNGNLQIGDSAS
ncbi:MAG: hypothetical protein ACHQQQ_04910 [Bacteroidota bacterium]